MKSAGYPTWIWVLVPVLLLFHQGSWFWNDARLVGGFPLNLLYHAVLSVFLAGVMWLVVRFAWPDHLDRD